MKTPRFLAIIVLALVATPFAAPAGGRPAARGDLARYPRPAFSGADIVAGLEEFVSTYPLRQALLPNNDAAAEFLAKEAEGLGYRTKTLVFQAGTPQRDVKVVEAVKRGRTRPGEWVVLVAHYDIANVTFTGATVEGAYDNGSGANLLRYFARAFAEVETKRSIAIVWPGDEDTTGFVATNAYARALKERGQKVAAVLGFDMAGIGYPAPYCICISWSQAGAEVNVPVIDHVNFEFLEFPEGEASPSWPLGTEGTVCNCGPVQGAYGEGQFAGAGYPTIRWHGMAGPGDYPWGHTPLDTVRGMEIVAGSRANLEEGMLNTFLSGYYTALMLAER
ncbi:MAG: M28 family peptidase [Actinomycetota bacterium]|nr:M28 family peptidase [Actinomycetota bacterium]